MKADFTKKLMKWNRDLNTRDMPWKGEKDPYRIWLSEIILQQTRVVQGLNYYNNFIKTFPDIHKLAKSPDDRRVDDASGDIHIVKGQVISPFGAHCSPFNIYGAPNQLCQGLHCAAIIQARQ